MKVAQSKCSWSARVVFSGADKTVGDDFDDDFDDEEDDDVVKVVEVVEVIF